MMTSHQTWFFVIFLILCCLRLYFLIHTAYIVLNWKSHVWFFVRTYHLGTNFLPGNKFFVVFCNKPNWNKKLSWRFRVRTPPGCEDFGSLYIAVLLSTVFEMHCHSVWLRKINASEKNVTKCCTYVCMYVRGKLKFSLCYSDVFGFFVETGSELDYEFTNEFESKEIHWNILKIGHGWNEGCQSFLGETFKKRGIIAKCTKWPYVKYTNLPQMAIKFSNLFNIPWPSKIYPNWHFWYENISSGNPEWNGKK
jgi:hypothetical protein